MNLVESEKKYLEEVLNNIDNSILEKFNQYIRDRFDDTLVELAESGPTLKLWVQYANLVAIGQNFLDAKSI